MQVLDYSEGFPGAAEIKKAGFGGAVRYIGFPRNPKCTNADELADFTAHELGMALVFELTAGQWRGGYEQGRQDYAIGRAHADAIGFPATRPIYMAIDQDVVHPHEFDAMSEYLRGARDEAGGSHLVGVYGEHDVCARAAADGYVDFFWQCRAWSGVPEPVMFKGRHLFQRVGIVRVGRVGCDINDVSQRDWGQHTVEGDDMFTEEDRKILQSLQSGKAGERNAGEVFAVLTEIAENVSALVEAFSFGEEGVRTAGEHTDWLAAQLGEIKTKLDTIKPPTL